MSPQSKHYVDIPFELSSAEPPNIGLTVVPANAANASGYFGSIFSEEVLSELTEAERPCVVSAVVPRSQADRQGVKPGDVLFHPWTEPGCAGRYASAEDIDSWLPVTTSVTFVARRLVHAVDAVPPAKRRRCGGADEVVTTSREAEKSLHLQKKLFEDGFELDRIDLRAVVPLPYQNFNGQHGAFSGFALEYYCAMGNLEMCRYLLRTCGVSVTEIGPNLAAAAARCRTNGVEVCRWVSQQGVDLASTGFGGVLPLHYAVVTAWKGKGPLATAKWLILNGGFPLTSNKYLMGGDLARVFSVGGEEVAKYSFASQDSENDEDYPQVLMDFIRDALPPEWRVALSQTRNKPYYVLNETDRTWYCPVRIDYLRYLNLKQEHLQHVRIDNRQEIFRWAIEAIRDQRSFAVFLRGTARSTATFSASSSPGLSRRSSPLRILGGKRDLLELIANFAGIYRGRSFWDSA